MYYLQHNASVKLTHLIYLTHIIEVVAVSFLPLVWWALLWMILSNTAIYMYINTGTFLCHKYYYFALVF